MAAIRFCCALHQDLDSLCTVFCETQVSNVPPRDHAKIFGNHISLCLWDACNIAKAELLSEDNTSSAANGASNPKDLLNANPYPL